MFCIIYRAFSLLLCIFTNMTTPAIIAAAAIDNPIMMSFQMGSFCGGWSVELLCVGLIVEEFCWTGNEELSRSLILVILISCLISGCGISEIIVFFCVVFAGLAVEFVWYIGNLSSGPDMPI